MAGRTFVYEGLVPLVSEAFEEKSLNQVYTFILPFCFRHYIVFSVLYTDIARLLGIFP